MRLQDRRRRAIGGLSAPIMLIMDSPGRLAGRRGRSCPLLAKSRAKIPAGKKQMLSVPPIDLIKVVKIAAIEDGLKLSGGGRGGASGPAGEAENQEADKVRVIAPTA
jgi:hypothetical protein